MMTHFPRLFREMFKLKARSVYFIFGLQSIITLILGILLLSRGQGNIQVGTSLGVNGLAGFLISLGLILLLTSSIFIFIFWLSSSRKNELLNKSQTWRLLPISDTKFFLANILSSLMSFAYLILLEIGVSTVLVGIGGLSSTETFRRESNRLVHTFFVEHHFWLIGLELLILVILLALAGYVSVSFFNLSTKTVLDFLPSFSSKLLIFIIRIVLGAVLLFLLIKIVSWFNQLYSFLITGQGFNANLGFVLLEFIIYNFVFAVLDIFLMTKFFEADQD